MSGRPLTEILQVLDTVLLRTHFGTVWLGRALALAVLATRFAVADGGVLLSRVNAARRTAACLSTTARSSPRAASVSKTASSWGRALQS